MGVFSFGKMELLATATGAAVACEKNFDLSIWYSSFFLASASFSFLIKSDAEVKTAGSAAGCWAVEFWVEGKTVSDWVISSRDVGSSAKKGEAAQGCPHELVRL